ncbi:hypothetical protein GCM10009590_23390 [Brachybacterium alimentarium]
MIGMDTNFTASSASARIGSASTTNTMIRVRRSRRTFSPKSFGLPEVSCSSAGGIGLVAGDGLGALGAEGSGPGAVGALIAALL